MTRAEAHAQVTARRERELRDLRAQKCWLLLSLASYGANIIKLLKSK
jgi:hypothetical protein